jgi:preprotein translocase subunit SecG
MTALPLLSAHLGITLMAILFVLCSIALILIVLVQKGRGGGLSGALGGGMASGILGSKTGDFLTWATIVLAGVFLFIAVLLAKFYRPTVGEYGTTLTQQTTSTTSEQNAGTTAPSGSSTNTPALPDSEQPVTQSSRTNDSNNTQTPGRN